MSAQQPRAWPVLFTVAVYAMCLAALFAIGGRVVRNYHNPGPLDGVRFGFCDFHNGIYFPALSVWERISPYSEAYTERYPVARATPSYAPATFLLHLPLAWLPLSWAEWIYYGIMIVCLGMMARIIQVTCGLPSSALFSGITAAVLIFSRAGYGTLFSGYFTWELALGTLMALHWGGQPAIGSWGFALAATKPTYGIPLAILLLARGHWRTVLGGSAIVGAASLVVYLWLLPGKPWDFLMTDIRFAQSQHMADWTEQPEFSWTRVDLLAIVAKWLRLDPSEGLQLAIMLVAIIFPARTLWRLRNVPEMQGLGTYSGILALLSLNVLLYRHYYDLVTVVPAVAVVAAGWLSAEQRWRWGRLQKWSGALIAILLLIALFNYGSTKMFFDKFQIATGTWQYQILTSTSGIALTLAWWCWWWNAPRLPENSHSSHSIQQV